jgi:hypothetical protein
LRAAAAFNADITDAGLTIGRSFSDTVVSCSCWNVAVDCGVMCGDVSAAIIVVGDRVDVGVNADVAITDVSVSRVFVCVVGNVVVSAIVVVATGVGASVASGVGAGVGEGVGGQHDASPPPQTGRGGVGSKKKHGGQITTDATTDHQSRVQSAAYVVAVWVLDQRVSESVAAALDEASEVSVRVSVTL